MSRKGSRKKKPLKIIIGTPSGGSPEIEFTQALFDLSRHPNVTDFVTNVSPRVAHNRNNVVRAFLKTDADALLFLDDDMQMKAPALNKLIETFDVNERPVVGGLCFGWDSGLIFTTLHMVSPETGNYVRVGGFPQDDVMEVDATGGACLLIARHVLEKVGEGRDGYPWFAEEVINGTETGEDIVFCRRVKEAGFPIHIATGARIVHIKGHIAIGAEQYVDQVNKRKYIFTGVGIGLEYVSTVMQHMNLVTGFESVFNGAEGTEDTLSVRTGGPLWGAWRGDASRHAVPYLEHFKGEIFHVVAHPLVSVPWLVDEGICADYNEAAEHWVRVNGEVERWATARIPLEVMNDVSFNSICWEIGTPRAASRIEGALDRVPVPVLPRRVRWEDLAPGPRALAVAVARRYGYDD